MNPSGKSLLLASLFLSACSSTPVIPGYSDSELTEQLIGSWQCSNIEMDADGFVTRFDILEEYTADRTYLAVGTMTFEYARYGEEFIVRYAIAGRSENWWIKDQVLYQKLNSATIENISHPDETDLHISEEDIQPDKLETTRILAFDASGFQTDDDMFCQPYSEPDDSAI